MEPKQFLDGIGMEVEDGGLRRMQIMEIMEIMKVGPNIDIHPLPLHGQAQRVRAQDGAKKKKKGMEVKHGRTRRMQRMKM